MASEPNTQVLGKPESHAGKGIHFQWPIIESQRHTGDLAATSRLTSSKSKLVVASIIN